jgi:predicted amidohydrolase YtcJ
MTAHTTNATDSAHRTKLVVDGMHLPEPSEVRALVWEDRHIIWVGDDPDDAPPADRTIAAPGAWATPGFVDAHVHATATGLSLDGLDLTGTGSAAAVVERLRDFALRHADDPIIADGWQEEGWPEAAPPTSAMVAQAAPGRRVVLQRVDGHSCVVDPVTLAAVVEHTDDGVDRDAEHRPTGWLREQAAHRALQLIWDLLSPARLDRARRTAVAHAAGLGITSMHEMGHPGLSTLDDALSWARGNWNVEVLVWWADIDPTVALGHGLRPGGDLFLDGAIGSRTAAVSAGYRDGPALGGLFHGDGETADFFVRCTRAGVGAGVHAIGDDAIEQAIAGIEAAAAESGPEAVRACRHRIEHVELPRDDHITRMARLGVVASLQPAFDRLWGGPEGMYASRFGAEVATASNPFAAFLAAGCPMAFGSDSTVTPMAPWDGVVAATAHRGGRGVDLRDALRAATIGGRYVAHQDDVGPLRAGHRADLAVWDGDPLTSADARSCLFVVVDGRITKSS